MLFDHQQRMAREADYRAGDRVRLDAWAPGGSLNEYEAVPAGTRGTVRHVDGAGTVHVVWDNGRTLGALFDDKITKLNLMRSEVR